MKVKSLYPTIVSENIEKALDFYKGLGFTVKHTVTTKANTHVYVLSCDDAEFELMEKVEQLNITPGLYGIRMNVDSIDEALNELKEKGYEIVAGPIETPSGKNLLIKDGDGNNITLIQHIKK